MANGGLAMKPSHHQMMPSFPPVDRRTTRSTSAYNLPYLDWGTRPTTYTDLEGADLPGQFQRMDQQYLSFNAQRRRMVSPAAPLHYIDHHYPPSSSGMPPRLDYHAAFDAPQNAHMMRQQNHVSQHQHHMGQRQYDMNQQQHMMPPQQNQKWNYPSKHNNVSHHQQQQNQAQNYVNQNYVNQWQYQQDHVGQQQNRQDYVNQQQRPVSQQKNHVSLQQNHVSQQQHHVSQQQNHVSQQQYNLAQQDHVTQQQNHVSQQKYNQPQYHDQLMNQQQYHPAQLDHVSQQNFNQYNVNQLQQHPVHQDHVSQQEDHVSQHKYNNQQQTQHHVSQQQYNLAQQDRVRQQQQQNNVSQQKYNRQQQQFNNSQQQSYVNQQQYHLAQQDHVSSEQKYSQHQYHVNPPQQHAIHQDHVSQQDHMRYNQQQNQHHVSLQLNQVSQQQHHVSQQQNHVSQQQHHVSQQQNNVSQQQHHVSQQQNHVSQQQDYVSQQQYNLTQQQDHVIHQQHQQQKNVNKKRHRVSQLQENHTGQQQTHANPQQQYLSSQQNHVNKHQYHMTQQQDHVTPQQDHVTQLNQPMVQHQTSLPDHQHYINSKDPPGNLPPPPDGYIKMQSVGAQVNQTSVTPPEYVVMNSHVNESPRSYSLNIPNTPPGTESPQKPIEVPHKQEPPRVAPKPSRPPKKSALLAGGANHSSMDTGDVSPSNSISPPHSEVTTPTTAPPVPVKKKNSLHRRKGLAIYDQPPAHSEISRISQQFESTSLSSPQTTQVPTTSHNHSSYIHTHTENTSPPVAPVTMAPDHDSSKSVSPQEKLKLFCFTWCLILQLPPGWFAEMDTGRGQFYYFNRDMGYTTWNYDEVLNIHHDNETKVSVATTLLSS